MGGGVKDAWRSFFTSYGDFCLLQGDFFLIESNYEKTQK